MRQRAALDFTYADREVTDVEIDALVCAANGLDVDETGDLLGKSPETVKTQRRMVLAKLRARNMTQAVAIGFRTGLLE